MKIKVNNQKFINFLQEGGVAPDAAPVDETAAAPEQAGGSPEEQLLAACQQALETQDCNLMAQICQAVIQMMGGGAPAAVPENQPVYKKGGRLVKWISK